MRGRSAEPAGRSPALAGFPDLLGRPLASPLDRDDVVIDVILRTLRCLQLPEPEDLEAVLAQKADPVAVLDVEVNPVVLGPFEPVHPELRALEPLPDLAHVRRADDRQRRVAEKDELAA